ncbi:MAG TPA: ABC transporter substrate-binding protein [Candidatus Acidoferrales bacterium]|nr:ABC transporter substrate-binding protein [Candidatus Acidoferrales bacterium]
MRPRPAFLLALILVLAPARALGASAPQPRTGGTLTMGINKDLTMMNPMVRTQSTDRSIRDLMYESLLGIDLRGNIQPYLADSWDISADGKVYTFRLRKDVRFHDGREMTAEDVKFCIDYTMNPKNAATGLSRLSEVTRVELPDKHTVRLHLKEPSPVFLAYLSDIQSFPVVPKGSLEEGVAKPDRFPPGTGPFRFVEWKPNQRIVFERFANYWGHKPFLDRVILRDIANSTARFVALRAGDLDMIERAPYEWVREIMNNKIEGVRVVAAPSAGGRRLRLNVADPPFNNKKLRLAVAHAINKEQILKAAYFGFGEVTDQKYPRGHVWYFDDVSGPAYDPPKARALLRESGYKGETIPITVRQGEDQETEAAVLQAQLKEIGINVKIDLVDFGTYVARQRAGEYAFLFGGTSLDPDPAMAYVQDLTCGNPRKRTVNIEGYCDREMDALLIKAARELNPKQRRLLFKQVVQRVVDDVPFIPIGYTPRFFALRDYVKGFTTNSEGEFRPWGGGLNYAWLDR